MLKRVRKINEKEILIFNYSNFSLNPECNYTTYKESRAHCLAIKDINLKRSYIKDEHNRTKIAYTLDDYDENYIYNKAEDMNSSDDCFLTSFISRALKKGYTYEFMVDNDTLNHEKRTRPPESIGKSKKYYRLKILTTVKRWYYKRRRTN
jgi:hypothetical protein